MKIKLQIDTAISKKVTVELIGLEKPTKIEVKQELGSQVLLPTIDKILKQNNLNYADISEILVNPGPGSFTGTRVGVSVANALGFALKIPINGKKGKIVEPIYDKSKFDI